MTMITNAGPRRIHGHAGESLPGRVTTSLIALARAIARSIAQRRARRELLDLPDFLLKDMGISRSDVPFVVAHGLDDTTRIRRGSPRRQGC